MTISNRFLALAGLIAASFLPSFASAQSCHSGFCRPTAYAQPVAYEPFYVRGVLFHFHSPTGGIFCDGVKVAQVTPSGEVVLLNKQPVGGVAVQPGGVAVQPGGVAVQQGVVGGPAVGGVVNSGPAVGGPAVGGPAVGGPVNGGPVNGGPVNGQAGPGGVVARPVGVQVGQSGPGGPVGQPGIAAPQGGAISAPVAGQVPPVSPIPAVGGAGGPNGGSLPPAPPAGVQNGPAPAGAVPAGPQPGNPTIPGPVAGPGIDPAAAASAPAGPAIAIDQSLLAGEWQAKTEDLAGRSTIRRLAFEQEGNVTLRLQTSGEEAFARSGKFAINGGALVLTDDEGKLELGQIASLDAGSMTLRTPEGLVNFARP